jgi:hypothetical protein
MEVRMNKILFYVLCFTWGLPQAIVGSIVYLIRRIKHPKAKISFYNYGTIMFKSDELNSGLSLAPFLFILDYDMEVDDGRQSRMEMHEFGHVKQSLMLGPLFLFVVGIPSICWLIIQTHWLKQLNYYKSFYTEIWADKMGHVVGRP